MITVTTFYKFFRISEVRISVLRDEITQFCENRDIRGLLLLSEEGCNATMSGSPEAIDSLKVFLQSIPEIGQLVCKDSDAEKQPFRRLKIDIRSEIVSLKRPDVFPKSTINQHLSPKDWHEAIISEEDILLIDTRNDYETEIGKFKGALDPKIKHFSQFPEFIRSQEISSEKKILMYCTGGIRCEKALVFMQNEGFKNVFQLEGGILNYLKEYPEGQFEGECFVFDHRVAVDSELKPSTVYRLCPHCGDPTKDTIECKECGKKAKVCLNCQRAPERISCSKNCANHQMRKLHRLVA